MKTILSLLFSLFFAIQVQAQTMGMAPTGNENIGPPAFPVNAVEFDGANDFLVINPGLTGAVDGKKGIASVWVKQDDVTGTENIYQTQTGRFLVRRNSNGAMGVAGANTSGTFFFNEETSNTDFGENRNWTHFLASWDTTIPGSAKVYIDDVLDQNEIAFSNDTIDYTNGFVGVGATPASGNQKFNGCMSEIYINYVEFLDLTVESNRRKFIGSTGKPVDLGSDGSTPTGTQPIVYLNGDSTNFQINQGSGENFAVTGALTACSTSPSD